MADHNSYEVSQIEAEENLLIDFQFRIQELMVSKNISRAELCERTGLSAARVSQIFSSKANPTVKTMARIFHALGETCHLGTTVSTATAADFVRPLKSEWKVVAQAQSEKRQDREMVAMVKRSMASNDNVVLMGFEPARAA